ncbi:LamG domain-containing protein [Streptomyces parvus]|uniref:LamG domain-containing protein n=1 Tax=Streptomyces parvus TaxID=66428 RepID=UPI0033D7DB80
MDWRDDRDGSVWFDGGSFVKTSQAVLDTSRSFTLSAWVRPTSADGFLTVAGQDGNNVSGFLLQYTPDDDRWRLAMSHQDSAEADEDEVLSAGRPATGTWQHLTGVFDAENRRIRLYVDGRHHVRPPGRQAVPSPWDVACGRARGRMSTRAISTTYVSSNGL